MATLRERVAWKKPRRQRTTELTQTLRVTPAMASGLADHVWSIDELIALMPEAVRAPWGSKKQRGQVEAQP